MDDLDMQLYEAAKKFKRQDFVASICNNCVIGHIEGFCESYQKALRIYGYDEDEIRKKNNHFTLRKRIRTGVRERRD